MGKRKGIYIEGLKSRIHQNVRNHWSIHSDVELPAITGYTTSVANIAAKGNESTPQHTNDTGNRGRRGGRTALKVENNQSSQAKTREIPYVDSMIEMTSIMMMEGGNSKPEDVE